MTLHDTGYGKTVAVDGMLLTVMSRYERAMSVGGRHFAAVGAHDRGYTLFEHDDSLPLAGVARCIGRSPDRIAGTRALVARIRHLVASGEQLPRYPIIPRPASRVVAAG